MPKRCGLLTSVAATSLCAIAIVMYGCDLVEVVAIDVAVVEIDPSVLVLGVGEQRPLSVKLRDVSGNELSGWPIQWQVENETVVAIQAGMLEGLAPGLSEVTARVNGIEATASVTVREVPIIGLASAILSVDAIFGNAAPEVPSIAITNIGQGTLEDLFAAVTFEKPGAAGWLSAAIAPATAPTSLNVVVDHSGLAPGTYSAAIIISSTDPDIAPAALPVELRVTVPPPLISLEETSVSFDMIAGGPDPMPRSLAVTNGGGGSLAGLGAAVTYAAGEPTGWLAASLSPASAPASLSLFVSGASLAVGEYHANVDIVAPDAENSPQSVNVTLTATRAPRIGLSIQSISFAAIDGVQDPTPADVQVINTGGGILTDVDATAEYAEGQVSGWLGLQRSGSTAPLTITLAPSSTGLPAGTFDATVLVRSPVASNSPRAIAVRFVVPEAPAIALSSNAVHFAATAGGKNPAPVDIDITNAGTGTLDGLTVVIADAPGNDEPDWLDVNLDANIAPTHFTIKPSVNGLEPGDYARTINVLAEGAVNSPQTVEVTFAVTPEPGPPVEPTKFEAHALSSSAIELSWKHDGFNETRFEIEYDLAGEWSSVATLPPNSTSYVHTGLDADTRYVYRLRACNDSGCSKWVQADAHTQKD